MERMTEKQVAKNTIGKLAIVVVTYKRQQLLATLFESIEKLTVAPWRIIVVDNEHSDVTQDMVGDFREAVTAQWGSTVADQSGNESRVVYAPQSDNLGGAGGFSAGVKKAYELGAEWFWVMDDDVAVMPEAIERLAKWTGSHDVIRAVDTTMMAVRSTGNTISSFPSASPIRSLRPHSDAPATA